MLLFKRMLALFLCVLLGTPATALAAKKKRSPASTATKKAQAKSKQSRKDGFRIEKINGADAYVLDQPGGPENRLLSRIIVAKDFRQTSVDENGDGFVDLLEIERGKMKVKATLPDRGMFQQLQVEIREKKGIQHLFMVLKNDRKTYTVAMKYFTPYETFNAEDVIIGGTCDADWDPHNGLRRVRESLQLAASQNENEYKAELRCRLFRAQELLVANSCATGRFEGMRSQYIDSMVDILSSVRAPNRYLSCLQQNNLGTHAARIQQELFERLQAAEQEMKRALGDSDWQALIRSCQTPSQAFPGRTLNVSMAPKVRCEYMSQADLRGNYVEADKAVIMRKPPADIQGIFARQGHASCSAQQGATSTMFHELLHGSGVGSSTESEAFAHKVEACCSDATGSDHRQGSRAAACRDVAEETSRREAVQALSLMLGRISSYPDVISELNTLYGNRAIDFLDRYRSYLAEGLQSDIAQLRRDVANCGTNEACKQPFYRDFDAKLRTRSDAFFTDTANGCRKTRRGNEERCDTLKNRFAQMLGGTGSSNVAAVVERPLPSRFEQETVAGGQVFVSVEPRIIADAPIAIVPSDTSIADILGPIEIPLISPGLGDEGSGATTAGRGDLSAMNATSQSGSITAGAPSLASATQPSQSSRGLVGNPVPPQQGGTGDDQITPFTVGNGVGNAQQPPPSGSQRPTQQPTGGVSTAPQGGVSTAPQSDDIVVVGRRPTQDGGVSTAPPTTTGGVTTGGPVGGVAYDPAPGSTAFSDSASGSRAYSYRDTSTTRSLQLPGISSDDAGTQIRNANRNPVVARKLGDGVEDNSQFLYRTAQAAASLALPQAEATEGATTVSALGRSRYSNAVGRQQLVGRSRSPAGEDAEEDNPRSRQASGGGGAPAGAGPAGSRGGSLLSGGGGGSGAPSGDSGMRAIAGSNFGSDPSPSPGVKVRGAVGPSADGIKRDGSVTAEAEGDGKPVAARAQPDQSGDGDRGIASDGRADLAATAGGPSGRREDRAVASAMRLSQDADGVPDNTTSRMAFISDHADDIARALGRNQQNLRFLNSWRYSYAVKDAQGRVSTYGRGPKVCLDWRGSGYVMRAPSQCR